MVSEMNFDVVRGFDSVSLAVIHVQWQTEFNRGYVISCYLVRKLTSDCLLSRMKSKGSKPAEFTRGLSK
jgi:hypothetical protein